MKSLFGLLLLVSGAEAAQVDLFPSDRVLDIRLEVAEEDWDTIRYQIRTIGAALGEARKSAPPPRPYSYVKARAWIDGVSLGDVGIRKKGFIGSQSSTRPSLKLKLNYIDKDQSIAGLTTLTLNNNRQDRTQLSQFLGYRFFNAAGSPAPRCAYAKVTINGENLGVYSHVETPGKPLLRRGFGDGTGTLYEGTVADFFDGWEGSFDRKVGSKKRGRAHLRQLIQALNTRQGVALVDSKATGRASVPTDDTLADQWTALEFDDSTWKAGMNGAGYETSSGYEELISEGFDLRKDLYNRSGSVYLRFPFEVTDPVAAASQDLILRVKYDESSNSRAVH